MLGSVRACNTRWSKDVTSFFAAEPVTESKNLEIMRKFSEQYAKR